MSVCSNCGAQGTRVRSRWTEKNLQLPDECPSCAPESFEKFTAPSDKKIWMGFEAHPNEYVKAEDGGYDRKPEYRAEQERQMFEATEEEKERQRQAEAHKRATRRTHAMDAAEMGAALRKAEEIADWIFASAGQRQVVN
jgi:hypothetical protein